MSSKLIIEITTINVNIPLSDDQFVKIKDLSNEVIEIVYDEGGAHLNFGGGWGKNLSFVAEDEIHANIIATKLEALIDKN